MKKILFLLMAFLFFSVNLVAQDGKIKVAVLDPSTSGISMDEGTKLAVQELISSTLVNTGNFTIVERSMIDKIVKEQSFQNSDIADNTQATEIGKLAGANKVILSAVSLVGGRNMLSIKVIDVETATIEKQRTKIVNTNDLLDVVEPLTMELIGRQGNYVKQNTVFKDDATANDDSKSDSENKKTRNSDYEKQAAHLNNQISKEIQVLSLVPNSKLTSLIQSGKLQKSTTLSSGLKLDIDNSGVLKISGNGAMTQNDAVLIKKYRNHTVALIVDEGVTNIIPFEDFSKMKYVSLPSSISNIAARTFKSCSSLQYIVIPANVTTIGAEAFKNCKELSIAILPDRLTLITESMFEGCHSLPEIIIPENVIKIDKDAFEGCSEIKTIDIPEGVMSIGQGCFKGMKGLIELALPENISIVPPEAFKGCKSLFTVTLPSNVHTIGNEAFANCDNLTIITFLCENMIKLGESCFEDCENLGNIIIHSIRPPVAEDLFDEENMYKSCILSAPESTIGLYRKTNTWKNFESIVPIK